MSATEIEEICELLAAAAERPEFGNSVPGSRRWCTVARGFLRARFPFPQHRQRQAE